MKKWEVYLMLFSTFFAGVSLTIAIVCFTTDVEEIGIIMTFSAFMSATDAACRSGQLLGWMEWKP